jgi:PiT family inorganic phosphate transporter
MGFSHGMNDATKCMGIITLALVAGTKAGLFENIPHILSFLRTPEGADPLHLGLGDKIALAAPSWLQFGYMPRPSRCEKPGGAGLGGDHLCADYGRGYSRRRLENHSHPRPQDGEAAAGARIRRGDDGRYGPRRHGKPWHAGEHDPRDTTSIMGVGCAKRFSALKFKLVERIVWAWVLTIPATSIVAFAMVWLCFFLGLLQPPK